ncbi:MAG: N-acetylmuramoyl-L-alanine amidase [Candidatus Bipolaricaulia bacterium]
MSYRKSSTIRLAVYFSIFLFVVSLPVMGEGSSCFLDLTRIPVVEYCPASPSNFDGETRTAEEINYIVIHTVQGSMESAIHTFSSSDLNYPRSAHYTIAASGKVVKSVPARKIAWHAGTSPLGSGEKHESRVLNKNSIGIEHGGYVSDSNFPTREQYYTSAALTRYLCELYEIPIDRQHIVGHEEIKSTKGDPGSNWNWNYYMNLVRNGSKELPTGPEKPSATVRAGGTNLLSSSLIAVGAAVTVLGFLNASS